MINRQWLLAIHPTGGFDPSCLDRVESSVPDRPAPGMVLVQQELIMCAPTVRNFISGRRDRPHPVVEIGQPVIAPSVCRVVESDDAAFKVGDRLVGGGSWQDFAWIDPRRGYRKLPAHISSVDALGRLGLNARTAYGGLRYVGTPKPGETLVVSGAAGSVGAMVMQIGRNLGCHIVGICGGGAKAAWLRDTCGITDLIDYKKEDVAARLDALCPGGVDIFFDNVGGPLLRTLLARMKKDGRMVLCGQIATYDGDGAGEDGPALDMMRIIYGRVRLQGFIGTDFEGAYDEIVTDLERWYAEGSLHHRQDIRTGFALLPEALMALFSGDNSGTLVVRVSAEDGTPL